VDLLDLLELNSHNDSGSQWGANPAGVVFVRAPSVRRNSPQCDDGITNPNSGVVETLVIALPLPPGLEPQRLAEPQRPFPGESWYFGTEGRSTRPIWSSDSRVGTKTASRRTSSRRMPPMLTRNSRCGATSGGSS
jgi:hypothetical protein